MARFSLRRKPKTAQLATSAIAVGGQLFFDGEHTPIRSSLERDFRALQAGGFGVSDSGLTKAVSSVVAMYACVNWLANQARTVPLIITDGGGEPLAASPLDWFINNQSEDVLSDSTRHLNIFGKAFIRKQYNTAGFPTGLAVINPNNIIQNVDRATGEIISYSLPRIRESIPVNQIIYIALDDPAGDGNPLSPTEAAFTEAGIEQGIATHAVSFFFNQAMPVGMVTFDPPLDGSMYEKAKKEWRANFRGAAKAHKTAILNGKAVYTPLQANLKDLAMDSLDDGAKQKICAAYGVNPAVVGLGDVAADISARSTFEDTKRASIEGAVVPTAKLISSGLTSQWAAIDFSPPSFYHIRTNERAMPALSDVNTERVGTVITMTSSNLWGYDEALGFLGQPIRENTEERIYWREDTAQALSAYNIGLISNVEFNQLTGLPEPNFAMRIIDGKTIAESLLPQFVTENTLAPPEEPSFFSEAGLDSLADGLAQKQLTISPVPKLSSDNRAADSEMTGFLSVSFANHTLVKMARRHLGKLIPATLEANWVNDGDWRLDILTLTDCTPALIGELIQGFDVTNRNHVELWSGEFIRDGDGISLAVDMPEVFTELCNGLSASLKDEFKAETQPAESLRIKLVDAPGFSDDLEALSAMPLVIDNISLVIDGEIRYTWTIERVTDEQRRELRHWQRKLKDAKRQGRTVEFNVEHLPENVVVFVQEQLKEDDQPLIEIWKQARKLLEARAIQATRLDYEAKIEGFIRSALSGNLDRARMGRLMRSENQRFIRLAYRDGLIDGGVSDGSTTAKDLEVIKSLVKKGNSFVANFTTEVFSGKLSQAQLVQKPAQWYRGAVNPGYTGGLLSADRNGMYECVRVRPSEDPCVDCPRLEGQRHRLSAWDSRNLLMGSIGQATKCEGHNCNHRLKKTKGRARGNW